MKENVKNYEKLVAKASAPAQITNDELISKLQKAISDIYAVMAFVPYEQDRIYSCIEGIYDVVEDLATDGPDTIRYAHIIDGE